MFARPLIDSLEFARRNGELHGEVPVAELPRLDDMLASREGKIGYVLRGLHGKDGSPQLELVLEGECHLRCQRCLNDLLYPVKLVSRLKLVPDEAESDVDDDELDYIPAEKQMDVLSLLEEELLLSLPIAPKHESGECQIAAEGLARSENPFAILAGLKK
ncbi:MAG TPA: YceD family protein [Gallionellaceae bacterium]